MREVPMIPFRLMSVLLAVALLLAVAEAVLEVVAVVLEDVEGLVLDLPPRPPAAARSTTVSGVTGRSVTKLLR